MRSTSALYKSILADSKHVKQVKVSADEAEFLDGDICGLSVHGVLYDGNGPAIGCAVCREIDLSILSDGSSIPRMAEICVSVRLALLDGDGAVESVSEWLPKGTFYIDTRELDASGEVLTIHGYDSMLKGEQPYFEGKITGTWPKAETEVMSEVCRRLGVMLDSRTELDDSRMIPAPVGLTVREVAAGIAASHAANCTITDENTLALVPMVPKDSGIDLKQDMLDFTSAPKMASISKVILLVDDENFYEAGDDTGRTIEANCPWASIDMIAAVFNALNGYEYQPYTATGAALDPAMELGDGITVNGLYSVLSSIDTEFDAVCAADVSAPGDEELDHEYPYKSSTARKFDRKLANTKAEIKMTTDSIQSTVEALDGSVSQIAQTVSGITLSVSAPIESGGQSYVEISLTVNGVTQTGYVRINGNVDISGQLSAAALYAAMGDVADLTVDKLSTSRRIVKYLAGDQSDDNYVRIQDQSIEFVAGVYAGGTEQARSPNGGLLYWDADPDSATIGSDGYPYKDGARIYTTTEETEWPVLVYKYTELVKRSIAFEKQANQYAPVDVFGAGNAQGRNWGQLLKTLDGLELVYLPNTGGEIGIKMGNDGYTDIFGLRKTTRINFTEFDNGNFYETVSGGLRIDYTVKFDESKRPVSITDDSGNTMEIYW